VPWKSDPDKRATAMCGQCGKTFSYYKSQPQEFCSKVCYGISRRTTTACPGCGTTFEFHKAWPRIYCSRQCAGTATRANLERSAQAAVAVQCRQCGQEFARSARNARQRFCSRPCWWEWRTVSVTTERVRRRQRKRPYGQSPQQRVCEECRSTFMVTATQDHSTHGLPRRFCSRACWNNRMKITNAGANGTGWRGGYEAYYGPSWRGAMRAVRHRDRVCVECGKSPRELGRQLDVHHLIRFKSFGVARHVEANALSNLVALCNACHMRREGHLRRGKRKHRKP
jgi:hypothetical protein